MKTRLFGAVTLAFCLFFAMGATAGTVAYDASLASPPGVYFGSGNPNAGFNVLTEGNLELGLGAIIRYMGPAPELGDLYYVPVGPTTVPGKIGPAWGFVFSVDTQAGGGGAAHLSDYTYLLTIQDLTNGAHISFTPLLLDNTYYGPGPSATQSLSTQWGFQNAESPSFFSAFADFNMNYPDNYKISLSATPLVGAASEVSIFVNSTPEPATFGLIGSALFGLGLVGSRCSRRRK
jgi:hypothetical protein